MCQRGITGVRMGKLFGVEGYEVTELGRIAIRRAA